MGTIVKPEPSRIGIIAWFAAPWIALQVYLAISGNAHSWLRFICLLPLSPIVGLAAYSVFAKRGKFIAAIAAGVLFAVLHLGLERLVGARVEVSWQSLAIGIPATIILTGTWFLIAIYLSRIKFLEQI